MARTLNIVGAGHVGRVLGRLFAASGAFTLQDVLTRSPASAQDAVDFIGAGRAVAAIADLRRADVTMLAVGDDQIAAVCAQLAAAPASASAPKPALVPASRPALAAAAEPAPAGTPTPAPTRTSALAGAVLFHCSGAKASGELARAREAGALVASVHPVRSFADPATVAREFAGTFCGVEGDAAALAILQPALLAIGAQPVAIDAAAKTVYHAASVFASNYLVTVLDAALRAYQAAGIDEATARALAGPLATETLANVLRLGAPTALSGPIARGDMATVARQLAAVRAWDGASGALYEAMVAPTVALAERKHRKDAA